MSLLAKTVYLIKLKEWITNFFQKLKYHVWNNMRFMKKFKRDTRQLHRIFFLLKIWLWLIRVLIKRQASLPVATSENRSEYPFRLSPRSKI